MDFGVKEEDNVNFEEEGEEGKDNDAMADVDSEERKSSGSDYKGPKPPVLIIE